MKEKVLRAMFNSQKPKDQVSLENQAEMKLGDDLYWAGYFIALAGLGTTLVGKFIEYRSRVTGTVPEFCNAVNEYNKENSEKTEE